jgi:hypothetical protein
MLGLKLWAKAEGFVNKAEGNILFTLLLMTAGFGWHVFAQRRAEDRFDAQAREAEINAFA